MRIESFKRAKTEIISYLNSMDLNAFTTRDLNNIFYQKKEDWRIADYRNSYNFREFLLENKIISLYQLSDKKKIWKKNNATNLDVGLAIKKGGYLSYYTSLQIHELTLQIPKTIYVSYDKGYTSKRTTEIILQQENVDKAFSKEQRQSSDIYKSEMSDGVRYLFLQKKHLSENIGVITINEKKVTDIERTLIDISVRPSYSGGVFEVLTAFESAKDRLNLEKLNTYLNELNYIYPYHQLIGFYLEKVGYKKSELTLFSDKITSINFYLTYNLSKKRLDDFWNIYYPIGF